MRKTIAVLAALFSLAAAGTAAADDPSAYTFNGGTMGSGSFFWGCKTPYKQGVYRADVNGYYVDGCTTPRISCPASAQTCWVTGDSFIDTQYHRGHRVTMNARIWMFNPNGSVSSWYDKSCAGVDVCGVTHRSTFLAPGSSAAVQCNGVRYLLTGSTTYAQDSCKLTIKIYNW